MASPNRKNRQWRSLYTKHQNGGAHNKTGEESGDTTLSAAYLSANIKRPDSRQFRPYVTRRRLVGLARHYRMYTGV